MNESLRMNIGIQILSFILLRIAGDGSSYGQTPLSVRLPVPEGWPATPNSLKDELVDEKQEHEKRGCL